MGIKGLTDQLGSGFDRIGKLYKGAPKEQRTKNGREYEVMGKDLEYFRIEFEPQYEHLRELWEDLYGQEPDEFEGVFLTAATTNEAFQAWKEEYNASATLLHRCDGENQVRWYNADAGISMSAKKMCEVKAGNTCGCKETGRLDFVFPEFCALAGVLGVISLTTHSVFDIITIHGRLQMLERINGSLLGVPLVFGRSKRQVSAPRTTKDGQRTGERMKVTKSLLYINPTSEFTQRRLMPMLGGALGQEETVALPATGTEGKVLSLGNGGTRRIDTSEPEITIVESVDPFANLRSALQEVELSIKETKEREIPGTHHIILSRAVTDVEAFKGWLTERFGEQIVHVGSEWFDYRIDARRQE